jgi:hypothetical protein
MLKVQDTWIIRDEIREDVGARKEKKRTRNLACSQDETKH